MNQLFPIVTGHEIAVPAANALLVEWSHDLGPCLRPFEQRAHALFLRDDPVAVTVTASPVSVTVSGLHRADDGVVELARICRHPDMPWVTRPMLRLWREVFAFDWMTWRARWAISYATPGRLGEIYRHDGWERVGTTKPSPGGGTWSSPPKVNDLRDGVKTLWRYRLAVA